MLIFTIFVFTLGGTGNPNIPSPIFYRLCTSRYEICLLNFYFISTFIFVSDKPIDASIIPVILVDIRLRVVSLY